MKAVVYEDIGKVRVDEVPEPEVEERGDAIVRITRAAICGSDLHFFHGKAPLFPGEQLGHEGVGVVEQVGDGVTGPKTGDRVVVSFHAACGECWFCRHGQHSLCEEFRNLGAGEAGGGLGGTQAERVRIPNADLNALPVPDDVSDERALFVGDILTTGYYGAAIAGIRPGDTVAVIGAGPVGFFAAQAARLHDPGQVLVLDMQPDRLELVEGMGLTPINVSERNAQTAVADATEGRGADVVIEAVGAVPAFESAVEVVRRGGIVCVLGMYVTESTELQLGITWFRTLDIRFAGITPIQAWWKEAMEAVRDGTIDPLPIISHRLPLNDAPRGYEIFDRREATKVVLEP
ncbi:MAG TPA: alcohol dehydrogenase catalytic domain-containing protein [Actinomycetota bacterium]|nr:alcohol dehydrogenase catalytic domain-containing protein [Actinomycetota bacterium]